MKTKQYALAHDAAKRLQTHPNTTHGIEDHDHKQILENVARKTSKLPHNEDVARDAEQLGDHDMAAKLRRMKKSETPNVRRIG